MAKKPGGWEAVEKRQKALLTQSMDPAFWRDYLTEHPEVLYGILGDLYRAVGNVSDRPPTLEDLWEIIGPKFSNEPFGRAVYELLGTRSVRWLARQLSMPPFSLQRIVNGERPVVNIRDPRASMVRLEAIARALDVHPSYFAEWRRLWIMVVLDQAFEAQPHLSVGVYRRFAGHQSRPRRADALNGR